MITTLSLSGLVASLSASRTDLHTESQLLCDIPAERAETLAMVEALQQDKENVDLGVKEADSKRTAQKKSKKQKIGAHQHWHRSIVHPPSEQ